MKRSPLQRKTPLKRGLSQLRRTPLKKKPSKGLRPRSKKRAAQESVYRKKAALFLQKHTHCKVCQDLGMTGAILELDTPNYRGIFQIPTPATEVHHMGRRHGKWLLDERFWLPVCNPHHLFIEQHGDWAREHGYLLTPEQKRQFQ